ncbi:MAG: transporter associated domain-containing protein, partial [Alphaproteobacteria bacterium]
LASIPVMAGLPEGMTIFNVAFVVVIASLLLQGWTVAPAARFLGIELPPAPEAPERHGIDLPLSTDREAASWSVAPGSPALGSRFAELSLPRRTRIIAVIREGTVMNRETLERLAPDDLVIALAPPQHVFALDRLFATPKRHAAPGGGGPGEFSFRGDVALGEVAALYGVDFGGADHAGTIDAFLRARLAGEPVVGDRVALGALELVVREVERGHILRAGLAIEVDEDEDGRMARLARRLGRAIRRGLGRE